MNILITGASGATGKLLTDHLLKRGHKVKVIVRSKDRLPERIKNHAHLTVIEASLLDLSDAELAEHIEGCDAVASCLGHNMTLKGVYGKPQRLVTDAARRLCQAIEVSNLDKTTKYVLMNTTGNSNRDLDEKISFGQKCVIGLLRLLLPPHVDNEKAADFLRTQIGQDHKIIEWAAVRPDGLIDKDYVSEYEIHASPQRSAIFDAGKVSRNNVAHFMADLITEEAIWKKWVGQMPVIYSSETAEK